MKKISTDDFKCWNYCRLCPFPGAKCTKNAEGQQERKTRLNKHSMSNSSMNLGGLPMDEILGGR